jgi:hypothetical protein
MRTKIWLSGLLMLSTCGCTGMNNTEQGAVTGGLLGGGLGLLLGGRHPLAATAIGAGAGTLVGGAIGSDKDRQDQRRTNAAIAAANAQAQRQMGLDEIVQLVQRGTPDDIIIQQISTTGSVFSLTTADITYLQDQRVSSRVINYMQTARRYVVQPRPVVIYERPYPPPEYGVGVVIRR